jgi:hypothetical protein
LGSVVFASAAISSTCDFFPDNVIWKNWWKLVEISTGLHGTAAPPSKLCGLGGGWVFGGFGCGGRFGSGFFGIGVMERQFKPEAAAGPDRGKDANFSAHAGDGFLDNGQADASAGVMIAIVQAFENSKNAVAMFGRDADAIVLYPDANEIFVFLFPDR